MMKLISIIFSLIIFCNITIGSLTNSPPTMEYDPNMAEEYLLYSYAAYCQRPNLTNWNCPTCQSTLIQDFNMNTVIYNITTDTQAYIGYRENQVLVVFRGSMDIQSWITNLQFETTPYPNCPGAFVHDGFYKAWLSVRDQVKEGIDSTIEACGSQCDTLVITGHSLGAAISSLCMADMIEIYTNLQTYSYSFGSPRVGDQTWSDYYNKLQPNQLRVVNQHDLVPHLPGESILDYRHVPTEVWYSSNSTYKVCDDSGEDPTCSDSVVGFSIYDHLHYFDQPCCCKVDAEIETAQEIEYYKQWDYYFNLNLNNKKY